MAGIEKLKLGESTALIVQKINKLIEEFNGKTDYALPLASSSMRGGVKIGYSENGANIPVKLSSEKAYVTVSKNSVTTALGYTPLSSVSWSDISSKPSLVTLDTAQTITGAKTYTANQIFKNGLFEIRANSANDDSWIKLTNSTDAGYYAFGIRRPYASYGLQMKYHPADSSGDKYYKIWHEDNDGAGSNLDADKLDGQQGSYYLNYNNLTNKPTIPVFPTSWELTGNLYLGQDKTELLGTDGLIRIGDGVSVITASAMDIYADSFNLDTNTINLNSASEITISSTDSQINLNSTYGVYVNDVEVGQTLQSLQSQVDGKLSKSEKAQSAVVADSASAVHWDNVTNKPSSYYTLPTASSSTLGGVKTGSNITNTSGTISLTKSNVTTALSYTPVSKSGDTLSDGATLTLSTYGTRFVTISGNSITANMSNETGGWAGAFAAVKHKDSSSTASDGTTTTTMLGWYGDATNLTHIFMGGTYSDPFMKFTPDGQFTFKKTPKVGTASLALASEVSTALSTAKTYTDTAVAGLVNSAPDALNTLKELSTALGDDPNFATTVANQIGGKLGKTEKATDSDKLDGQDGSYYLNYNNLTNKPSIPSAYSLPLAASGTRGGIQIGYTASGANIPLQLSSEKAYVALTSSAVTSALTYTPANDTAVVKLAGAQTITGDKITTGAFTIRNGSASGAFVLGADVNAKTLTANTRKLGRMGVPSYDSTTKTVAGISFDSQVNANYADFGGHPNNAISIAPDVIRFVVANEHNNSVSGARTLALQISKQAGLSDTSGGGTSVVGAKFFVPVIVDGNISATSITENGTALSSKYQAKGNYLTGITKSQVTTALGYTPATQDVATTSKAGLMSAVDKDKLDNIPDTIVEHITVNAEELLMSQDVDTFKSLTYRYLNNEIVITAMIGDERAVVTGITYRGDNDMAWTVTVPITYYPDDAGLVLIDTAATRVCVLHAHDGVLTLAVQDFTLPKGTATQDEDGLMSWQDKAKLDGLSNYSLPVASSSTRGGIKIGYSASGANVPVQLSSEKAYVALTKSAVTSALGYTPPTTNDISTAISNLVDSSPDALNTLNELAAALGDDPNFATTVSTKIGNNTSAITALQTAVEKKLEKTTYEKSAELACGSNGKVCLGKFGAYDTNITIELNSTTNNTYHATIIIHSQNVVANGTGGTVGCYVYGDADNHITPLISVFRPYGSASRQIEVYANLPGWSKNLVHVQAVALSTGGMTDVLTSVETIPTSIEGKTTVTPVNVLTTSFLGKTEKAADSAKLNGQEASYYLNYNNLSNKPTIPSAYSLPLAASGTRGGVQIGYTESGANIPVKLSSEKAYVTVSKNSVTTALGYTPLSTAGGTLTGDLTVGSTSILDNAGHLSLTGVGNPYVKLQATNGTTFYFQAVSDKFYIGPTSSKALAFDSNGAASLPSTLAVTGAISEGGTTLANKYQAKGNYLTSITKDQVTTALGYTPPKLYRHYLAIAITHNSQTLVGAVSFVDSRSTAHTLATMNSTYNAVPMYFTATNSTTHGFTGMLEFSSASQVKLTGLRYSSGTMSVLTTTTVSIAQLLKASVQEV